MGSRDAGPPRRGPRVLGDVLGELFAARGLSRVHAASTLETAWSEAVGEAASLETRVAGLRHGVLTVTVAHSALLGELAAFRKPMLLEALRSALPDETLHDLRFRVGSIDRKAKDVAEDARPPAQVSRRRSKSPGAKDGPK